MLHCESGEYCLHTPYTNTWVEQVIVEWLWIDGSPWGYEAWLASEPNQMHNAEDYLNINWAAHIGLWADNPRGSLGFVCQYNQKGG